MCDVYKLTLTDVRIVLLKVLCKRPKVLYIYFAKNSVMMDIPVQIVTNHISEDFVIVSGVNGVTYL